MTSAGQYTSGRYSDKIDKPTRGGEEDKDVRGLWAEDEGFDSLNNLLF